MIDRMYQPGSVAAPVVMAATETPSLLSIASRLARVGSATLGACDDVEAPLPEPEGEHETVWREGWGYVERLVEVEQPECPEVAAA